ncbi:TSUP family transporter, partial [Brevundimonas sp.]|uniref:TSUP family transporter n=1 Tax=Brevundimonas sp. TaxID=1871086 RepID=UPI0027E834BF
MDASVVQLLLAVFSGSLVALLLTVFGGGGSVLAVPLLLYVVGVQDPHVAIGASAAGVALNALTALAGQARAGRVRW